MLNGWNRQGAHDDGDQQRLYDDLDGLPDAAFFLVDDFVAHLNSPMLWDEGALHIASAESIFR